jgi:hypothetical protein
MVEMRYFGGYSEQEIADTLGITERTVHCVEGYGGGEIIWIDLFLRSLRDAPRFRALLVRMKLYGDPPRS